MSLRDHGSSSFGPRTRIVSSILLCIMVNGLHVFSPHLPCQNSSPPHVAKTLPKTQSFSFGTHLCSCMWVTYVVWGKHLVKLCWFELSPRCTLCHWPSPWARASLNLKNKSKPRFAHFSLLPWIFNPISGASRCSFSHLAGNILSFWALGVLPGTSLAEKAPFV